MIEVNGVCKRYGKDEVLGGVTFAVPQGSVLGLVGVNGAGKSTLLRILAGVMRADAGSVRYDGQEVFENTQVKRGLFFLPDEPYFAAGVTAADLCRLYAAFYPLDTAAYRGRAELFSLPQKKPVRNFSKGMRRQLFLSLALSCRPRWLLLDEAFDGLDAQSRLELRRELAQSCGEGGMTAVIASHSLRELSDICDRFALLGGGRVQSCGELAQLQEHTHKFTAAFAQGIAREALPFPCLTFESSGRLATFVARGDGAALRAAIEALGPLFVEEQPVDLEEFFIAETEGTNGPAARSEKGEKQRAGDGQSAAQGEKDDGRDGR